MNFICFLLFVTKHWLGFTIVLDLVIQHFTVLLFKYSLVIAGRPNGWCLFNSNQRYDDGADVEYSKGLLGFRVYFLKMFHI